MAGQLLRVGCTMCSQCNSYAVSGTPGVCGCGHKECEHGQGYLSFTTGVVTPVTMPHQAARPMTAPPIAAAAAVPSSSSSGHMFPPQTDSSYSSQLIFYNGLLNKLQEKPIRPTVAASNTDFQFTSPNPRIQTPLNLPAAGPSESLWSANKSGNKGSGGSGGSKGRRHVPGPNAAAATLTLTLLTLLSLLLSLLFPHHLLLSFLILAVWSNLQSARGAVVGTICFVGSKDADR